MVSITEAKKVMKKNFLGPEELKQVVLILGLKISDKIPAIPYTREFLAKIHEDYVLILGVEKVRGDDKLTLNYMRKVLGVDPSEKEPCFYNQDWYLNEKFASETTLENKWYLISREVVKASRGIEPKQALHQLSNKTALPSAILTAYTFFAYYFATGGEILWQHDFVWCEDFDNNGDRIYTGRYIDPDKINKNGFNIHRHLSIRPCYGCVELIGN
ncbi:hypothetical protein KJ641_03190 [Patescibacteria group bacterium]|nr:hypothetical protein [Patescibacteria group bacterium]